jgi:hypothetical protein
MRNVIQAWRNSAAYLKLERAKTDLLRTENKAADQKNALAKWRARYQRTKVVRLAVRRTKEEVRKSTLL